MKEADEWALYDDPQVLSISGNWMGLIEYCLEKGFYPTAIFYEKQEEEDIEEMGSLNLQSR